MVLVFDVPAIAIPFVIVVAIVNANALYQMIVRERGLPIAESISVSEYFSTPTGMNGFMVLTPSQRKKHQSVNMICFWFQLYFLKTIQVKN